MDKFVNADKLTKFIEDELDPTVQALMRLVYGEFLMAITEGKQPEGSVDLLYCFESLQSAFRRKDALKQALKGKYGKTDAKLEWT